MKKLYRSEENKSVFGVIGGLGEYFGVDPVVLRVIYIFLMFATAIVPLILGYFVAAIIVPRRPLTHGN